MLLDVQFFFLSYDLRELGKISKFMERNIQIPSSIDNIETISNFKHPKN